MPLPRPMHWLRPWNSPFRSSRNYPTIRSSPEKSCRTSLPAPAKLKPCEFDAQEMAKLPALRILRRPPTCDSWPLAWTAWPAATPRVLSFSTRQSPRSGCGSLRSTTTSALVTRLRSSSTTHPTLQIVTVHPSHQGRGVGRALVNSVAEWARQLSADRLTITTATSRGTGRSMSGSGSRCSMNPSCRRAFGR